MSIIVTVYVPGAIVMASDSRQSIIIQHQKGPESPPQSFETVNSDSVYKTFLFPRQHIGVSSYGDYILGGIFLQTLLLDFQEGLVEQDDICTVAEKLLKYFRRYAPEANTSFHIAGFKKENRTSHAWVYTCHVGRNELNRVNLRPNGDKRPMYGATWGGQTDVLAALLGPSKLVQEGPHPNIQMPIIWEAMAVQDAIDFAIYAVQTTIDTIRFQARSKSVGGPIDTLLITPEETRWIQRKVLTGKASHTPFDTHLTTLENHVLSG